jgi:hypothetical protein
MTDATALIKTSDLLPCSIPHEDPNSTTFDTHKVNVNSFTWNRDSHSLFDTEVVNNQMKKVSLTINEE